MKLYDKKVYQISLISNNQLLVILSGKERIIRIKSFERFLNHSESSFDSKISDKKNINFFTVHPITLTLCFAIKNRIFIYKIHSNPQPYPYTYMNELNTNQTITYLEISLLKINNINEQILCFGYSSTFMTYGIDQQSSNIILLRDKDLALQISREQSNEIIRVIPVIDSSINNELLLVYHKFGIYINYLTGIRTRHEELMWSGLPNSTSYSDPYLFIYTEKSIDIYNILLGIWLQSFSLTDTYPLTLDGSISISYDSELDKHHAKLIYITEPNRLTISLDIPKQISPRISSRRDGGFRSHLFSSMKATHSPIEISISGPTDFRHVEHLGRDDGLTILSRKTQDQQNDGHTSTVSNIPDGNGANSDNSFDESFQLIRTDPRLVLFSKKIFFFYCDYFSSRDSLQVNARASTMHARYQRRSQSNDSIDNTRKTKSGNYNSDQKQMNNNGRSLNSFSSVLHENEDNNYSTLNQ
jgi:hypothetical protein